MPRFAANISTMYTERPFLERFAAARRDGFAAVECQFPYVAPADAIRSALEAAGLSLVLINTPAGDAAAGERGLAALPGREAAFRDALDQAVDHARVTGCSRIHLMAGVPPDDAPRAECETVFAANLRHAARLLGPLHITGLIEPINPRDMPGYFLRTQGEAHALLAGIGEPALAVQMDLYHCQVVEGDVATRIRRHIAGIGHVQIAGVPGREEPDRGELHYPYLFALLDALGYDGWVGCEYRPHGDTSAGLGWLHRWRETGA